MPSTGIYKIENKVNGRVYIGQSVNIENRWREHKRGKQSPNMVISRAIKKYGSSHFTFDIIELCSRADLNTKEVYWISVYNSYKKGYNSTTGGDAPTDKSSNKLTNEMVKQIRKELLSNVTMIKDIAKAYKVSATTVTSINTGASWFDESLCYPIRTGNNIYLSTLVRKVKQSNVRRSMKSKEVVYCKSCGTRIKKNKSSYCKLCVRATMRKVKRPSKIALIAGILSSNQTALGLKYGVSSNSVKKWCKTYNIPVTKKGFKFTWKIKSGVGKGSRILISNF